MRRQAGMKSLARNSDHLSEPNTRRRVMMYSGELPTCLVKQVTKMGYCALIAIEESHHLQREETSAKSIVAGARSSYRHVEIVYHRGCATEIGEQRLRRYGELCTGDLVCGGFVTGICHQLVHNNKLGLRASGIAQTFQYGQAIFVCPVVKHPAQKEDRNVLLRRLRVQEVLAFGIRRQKTPRAVKTDIINLGSSRGRIQARLACSSSKTVVEILSSTYNTQERSVYLIHIPQLHHLRQTRGPVQRSEGADDV